MVRYRYRLKFNNVFFLNNDLVARLQFSNIQSVVRKIRLIPISEGNSGLNFIVLIIVGLVGISEYFLSDNNIV